MDPKSDAIRDYILANRDRYTREAITQQLIAAGHDMTWIDEAWEGLVTAESVPHERKRNPRLVAYVMLAYGVGLAALFWTGYWDSLPQWLVAYVVIGGLSAFLLMRLRVSGMGWALVVPLVPLFFAAVWYGTCLVTFNIYCTPIFSGRC